jgi:hypothetical protein
MGTDLVTPQDPLPIPSNARLAFVSSTTFIPSGGRAAMDAQCNQLAGAASAPTAGRTFKAFVATTTEAAGSRFADGAPWFRRDGVQLATTASVIRQWSQLTSSPSTTLAIAQLDEHGSYAWDATVFTGTNDAAALSANSCGDWQDSDGLTTIAHLTHIGFLGGGGGFCSEPRRIYCFEE